jgi:hypothetical protein
MCQAQRSVTRWGLLFENNENLHELMQTAEHELRSGKGHEVEYQVKRIAT